MDKKSAIRIITCCAKVYNEQLENKNLLFLFGPVSDIENFEATFLPKNFLHLTGVTIPSQQFKGSSDFYEKCLKGQLSPDDIGFARNGTIDLKLQILPRPMQIQKNAKMVGDYNFSKSLLITEKVAGSVVACMGFVRDDKYYIPNTALKEDIRNIVHSPTKRVLAVLKKNTTQKLYNELCYTAKGISLPSLNLSLVISQKISPALLHTKEFTVKVEKTPINDLLVKLTHGKENSNAKQRLDKSRENDIERER